MCQWLRCGLSGMLYSFQLAWSSQPQPSSHSWDRAQTAITTPVGLCLSLSHHPSPCPSSLAIGVWTSGLGKWQEESTKLTIHPLGLSSSLICGLSVRQHYFFFFFLFAHEKLTVWHCSAFFSLPQSDSPSKLHQQTLKGLCVSMRPISNLPHLETRK